MEAEARRFAVVMSTTGTMEEASKIAEHLVSQHLVACVNILPSVRSIYWWKDSVQRDDELLMIMKTEFKMIPRIEEAIRSLHSYDVPELIVLPIEYGLPEYLKWIGVSLS